MPADEIDISALDLSSPRQVHIVGVAGVAMSAIALLLARMGHHVTGSDLKDTPQLARLEAAGVQIFIGNRAENVSRHADAVVYSTAIPANNVELIAARALGVPLLHRSLAQAAIARTRRTIAVAGSHGKTTTSSMLALILHAAGWHPTFLVGGELNEVGTNAAVGDGEWFVVEADESDGTFLRLSPEAAIVTNIEPDHLDYYGDFDALVQAFEQFVDGVPGPILVGADDPNTALLASTRPSVMTYGEAVEATYRVSDVQTVEQRCTFRLSVRGVPIGVLVVPLGVKVAANAAGAAAMALEIGVPFDAVARALRGFGGVSRRFQHRGVRGGVTFIDDYAHLPTEVKAAIAAVHDGGWKRVIVVFQPHRYTRTASLWRDFADAFIGADAVVITDVYPAGEQPIAGVSGRLIAQAITERHPDAILHYVPGRAELADLPARLARSGDVVLTLGAGDVTTLPDVWLADARSQE